MKTTGAAPAKAGEAATAATNAAGAADAGAIVTHAPGHTVPPLGRHVLADLHGVDPALLRDPEGLRDLLTAAALGAGAQVLGAHFHHFGGGQGVTGVVLLSESHITIHTWPEHSYAALDVFMCGHASPERAVDHVRSALAPAQVDINTVPRGASRHIA